MANHTPHVVGGGLGTFRKQAQAKREAEQRAKVERERKAAFARVAKATTR